MCNVKHLEDYKKSCEFQTLKNIFNAQKLGVFRESNSGPLAPEARIIPLDHQASHKDEATATVMVGE